MKIHVDLEEGQVGPNDTTNETSCDIMDYFKWSSGTTAIGAIIDIIYAVSIYQLRSEGGPGARIVYYVTLARFILEDAPQLYI